MAVYIIKIVHIIAMVKKIIVGNKILQRNIGTYTSTLNTHDQALSNS